MRDDRARSAMQRAPARQREIYHIRTLSPRLICFPPMRMSAVALRRICVMGVWYRIISDRAFDTKEGYRAKLSSSDGDWFMNSRPAVVEVRVASMRCQETHVAPYAGSPMSAPSSKGGQIVARHLSAPAKASKIVQALDRIAFSGPASIAWPIFAGAGRRQPLSDSVISCLSPKIGRRGGWRAYRILSRIAASIDSGGLPIDHSPYLSQTRGDGQLRDV